MYLLYSFHNRILTYHIYIQHFNVLISVVINSFLAMGWRQPGRNSS
jgi:hypothetical protein